MFSLFGCSGFMHLLCNIVGHNIFNLPPHPYSFKHIVLDLLGRISGSNMFTLMFLTLFSLYFSCIYGVKIFARVPYPQHYDTGCLDEESLECIGLRIEVVETMVVLWGV